LNIDWKTSSYWSIYLVWLHLLESSSPSRSMARSSAAESVVQPPPMSTITIVCSCSYTSLRTGNINHRRLVLSVLCSRQHGRGAHGVVGRTVSWGRAHCVFGFLLSHDYRVLVGDWFGYVTGSWGYRDIPSAFGFLLSRDYRVLVGDWYGWIVGIQKRLAGDGRTKSWNPCVFYYLYLLLIWLEDVMVRKPWYVKNQKFRTSNKPRHPSPNIKTVSMPAFIA
jgi:hypothetical protein